MADFGNFQVDTTAEVMARARAGLQRALESRDPVVRNAALFGAAIQQITGTPELRKAQATEKALQQATTRVNASFEVQRGQGVDTSQIGKEIATLRAQRDALLQTGQVEAASKANQALTVLGIQQAQQRRLKAQDARTQESHEEIIQTQRRSNARAIADGNVLHFQNDDKTWETLNLDDPLDQRKVEQFRKEGRLGITNDQRFELDLATRKAIAKAENAKLGKTAFNAIEKETNNVVTFMRAANKLTGVLAESPNALTLGTKGSKAVDNALFTYRDAMTQFFDGTNVGFDNQSTEDQFFKNNVQHSRARGLITAVAYATARAEDSGRLSDQDFERAAQIVGAGAVRPEVLLGTLKDRVTLSAQGPRDRLNTFPDPDAKQQFSQRGALIDRLEQQFLRNIETINSRMRKDAASAVDQANQTVEKEIEKEIDNLNFKIEGL